MKWCCANPPKSKQLNIILNSILPQLYSDFYLCIYSFLIHYYLLFPRNQRNTAGECIVVSSSSSSSSSGRPSGNSGVVSSGAGGNNSTSSNSTAVYGRLVPEEQLAALGRGLSVINPNAAINSSSLGNRTNHFLIKKITKHRSFCNDLYLWHREFISVLWRW